VFESNYTHQISNLQAQLHSLTQLEQKILRHLIYYASKSWGYCRKSYKTIADELGCSRDKIYSLIKKLKPLGVETEHRGPSTPIICVAKELKEAFLSLFAFNYDASTTLEQPIPYIDKYKNNNIVIVGAKPKKQKPESALFKPFRALGLTAKEVVVFLNLIRRNKIALTTIFETIKVVAKAKKEKAIHTSIGAYFRAVLLNIHNEAIITQEQLEAGDMTKYRETLFPMPPGKQEGGKNPRPKGLTITELGDLNPHNIPIEMISDWITVRTVKRAPITITAWKRINKQLSLCDDPVDAFEIMVAHGWQSLDHKWISRLSKSPGYGSFDYDDTSWAEGGNKTLSEKY